MGFVHIYCGDGKGKTSAAVGLAVRAAGRGFKVAAARFLKTDDSGEVEGLASVPGIHILPCRKAFGFVSAMDSGTKREAAAYCQELFREAVALSSEVDLLVLDEIMAAMNYGMIPEDSVINFLKSRPEGLEVVLTGREPSDRILMLADYVSEIRKIKHPFDRGISARKGIEY